MMCLQHRLMGTNVQVDLMKHIVKKYFNFLDLDLYGVGRMKSIDGLRGIAALAVVVHHAATYGNYQKISSPVFQIIISVLNQGYLGVPLFFVISGFCIHLKAADQIVGGVEPRIQFIEFWKRRILRLYPTYFVVLVFSMSLLLIALALNKSVASLEIYPEPKLKWMSWDFFAHTFMLHGLHPIFDKGGGNSPFWTLAREEYLYLLYGPLLFLRRHMTMSRVMVLVGALSIVGFYLGEQILGREHLWWGVWSSSALLLWVQWAAGAYSAEIYRGVMKIPKPLASPVAIIFFGVAAKISESHIEFLAATLWAVCFLSIVIYFTQREKNGKWSTSNIWKFFSRVGVYSYSIYLLHHPIKGLMKHLVQPFGLADTQNPLIYFLMVVVITIICVCCSRILFELVESRSLKRNERVS